MNGNIQFENEDIIWIEEEQEACMEEDVLCCDERFTGVNRRFTDGEDDADGKRHEAD